MYTFTSPEGAVAQYCDEHVCVSVCLSASISPEPHARSKLPHFSARCLWPWYSVCQASANRNPEILSASDTAYRPGRR